MTRVLIEFGSICSRSCCSFSGAFQAMVPKFRAMLMAATYFLHIDHIVSVGGTCIFCFILQFDTVDHVLQKETQFSSVTSGSFSGSRLDSSHVPSVHQRVVDKSVPVVVVKHQCS